MSPWWVRMEKKNPLHSCKYSLCLRIKSLCFELLDSAKAMGYFTNWFPSLVEKEKFIDDLSKFLSTFCLHLSTFVYILSKFVDKFVCICRCFAHPYGSMGHCLLVVAGSCRRGVSLEGALKY